MDTIRELFLEGKRLLESNDIPDADLDARYLLEYCLGVTSVQFYMRQNEQVEPKIKQNYINMINKRCTHYPLQYIIGTQDFMGFEFKVNENVLIPRQDTEILVENVLKNNLSGKSVLDMCTGSGCIAISIKKLAKDSKVCGVDISNEALDVAKGNAAINEVDVDFIHSDLFNNVSGRFDFIVSNPPYIRQSEIMGLMEEVKNFEPVIALDGFEDGLFFYRRITECATRYINHGGMLYYEIGYDQGEDVTHILKENGFHSINVIKDLAGLDRVVYGTFQSSGME